MHKTNASVSVVVPCFRCSNTIVRAVESIAAQTIVPAQVLLVDDASDDDTLAVIRHLAQKYPSGWIQILALERNCGAAAARNAGWERASQRYVAFLDADDSWHPQKIELQYRWMLQHPSVVLTGHASAVCGDSGFKKYESVTACAVSASRICLKNYFPTRSVMLLRSLPQRFEDGKRYAEDYLLWMQIILMGGTAFFFTERLAFSYKEDFGQEGLSGQLLAMERGELSSYRQVYRDGLISLRRYIVVSSYSLIKCLRRILVARVFRRINAGK